MTARIATIIAIAMALCVPATAKDGVRWTLGEKAGQPHLIGMSTEEEADTEFWALCKGRGVIEIGVGANSNAGKGEGEKIALTLKSGGQAASLSGVSRNSENSEMTGGSELRAQVKADDPLFAVLTAGKPIAVTGNIEHPGTWPVSGLKAKAAAFLAACKK